MAASSPPASGSPSSSCTEPSRPCAPPPRSCPAAQGASSPVPVPTASPASPLVPMEPAQIGDDAPDFGTVKSEVDGESEMTITEKNDKKICMGNNHVKCYHGTIKSGTTGSQPIKATIFAFECDADEMATLHKKWSTFDHPSVMKSLGYSRGSRHQSKYGFVAFPIFHLTFSDLIAKGSRAVEMGRFTEVFIEAVSQIIKGLQALHDNGFSCPNLKGADIAIKLDNNSVDVKIWNFSVCTSAIEKNLGWKRIGDLLLAAAGKNFANSGDSLEIHYLCNQIWKGQLRGLDILRQSALLSVREKFEKVLSLWIYASVHCKPESVHQLDESKSTYTLTEFLDVSSIGSIRPLWIESKRIKPAPKTLRDLLDELRDIIEHEVEYIPPDVITELGFKEIELGKTKSDLEHYIRKSWTVEFLMIQLWACDQTAELEFNKLVDLKKQKEKKT